LINDKYCPVCNKLIPIVGRYNNIITYHCDDKHYRAWFEEDNNELVSYIVDLKIKYHYIYVQYDFPPMTRIFTDPPDKYRQFDYVLDLDFSDLQALEQRLDMLITFS
jgi:hypothetical protein